MSHRLMALVAESAQFRAQRARVDPEDRDAPPGVATVPDDVDGTVELPPGDEPGGPMGDEGAGGGGGGGGPIGVLDDGGDGMGMGDSMPAPPNPPADPAVIQEIRNVRDQVELQQRDNQDTQELLRDLVREVRQVRLDDASPEERDEEMGQLKERLDNGDAPASPSEFGMPNAKRNTKGNPPMSDLRSLRRQRVATRRTAQSNAEGEIFPEHPDVTLDEHWGTDTQEDAQRTTPVDPEFTDERGLNKITQDSESNAPEWMEKESASVKAFDLEFVAGKTPFYVVSDLKTRRPLATFTRPQAVSAQKFADLATYGKGVLTLLGSEGFAKVMKGLGGKRVDEVLAARIRAARGEAPPSRRSTGGRRVAQDATPAATMPAAVVPADMAPLDAVFDDPQIAAAVDELIASRDAALERCFKMALAASVAGHIDNPLKGALMTLLSHVIDDPGGFVDDAIAMSADRLFDVIYRQAREWMRVSPETLISIEGMISRRGGRGGREMAPRYARGRVPRETPASLRRRAIEGSDVPMSVEPGVTGWGDEVGQDSMTARIRSALPGMEAHARMRRITSTVPSGRFGG